MTDHVPVQAYNPVYGGTETRHVPVRALEEIRWVGELPAGTDMSYAEARTEGCSNDAN